MDTIEFLMQNQLFKIQRDPYYSSAYSLLPSLALIKKSGFFEDKLTEPVSALPQFSAQWFTTPVYKIINNLKNKSAKNEGRHVVLLTTGSFCPVHKSHIEMMELAKIELEHLGYIVLGGYLSPSHDAYVSDKCKQQTLSGLHRLRLCEEATFNSDWLVTDSWEALHTPTAINFTDVIIRLEHYLAHHVKSDNTIEIVYVFGSDNADFAYAFIGHGHCVCIERPGYEKNFAALQLNPLIYNNANIILSAESTVQPGYSSQKIRQGEDEAMTERVKEIFRMWQTKQATLPTVKKAIYYLRNEGSWAYAIWLKGRNEQTLALAWNDFIEALCVLFHKQFINVSLPDDPFDLEIQQLYLSQQYEQAAVLMKGKKVLSLDPCIEGEVNIGVSRCFFAGVGIHRPQLIARPGWNSLEAQIQAIPAGEYVLFDDDIVTGTTIKKIMNLLPAHIKIQQIISLVDIARDQSKGLNALDVSDCRDFLAGANEAGMVLQLPNEKLARVPYMLPYVYPSDRASTPLSSDTQLSYELWKINFDFFKKIHPVIMLKDSHFAFQEMMFYLGFTETDSMQSICQWHMDRLLGKP